MKKIGIVLQQFPVPSETFIVTKVLNLIQQGFEVTIFATTKSKHWNNYKMLMNRKDVKNSIVTSVFRFRGSKFIFVFASFVAVLKSFMFYPMMTFRLLRNTIHYSKITGLSTSHQFLHQLMFVGKHIDILHIEFDFQAYGLVELKKFLKCSIVVSGRGSIASSSIPSRFPNFFHHLFSHVDHYHFISQYLLNASILSGLPQTTRISLIEPAIDLSLFCPTERRQNKLIKIVTTGRLVWAKGYEFAIDAIAMVHHVYPDIQYEIIGSGPYKDAVLYAASQHNLINSGVVSLKGEIKREEVANYLQDVDLMLHLALDEGFCNAVIEGQAMEIPVVCSDSGGLPENIENGVTGIVVPRRDARAAADAVIKLIENPALRIKMGKMGRARAIAKYNIHDQGVKFTEMYQSI